MIYTIHYVNRRRPTVAGLTITFDGSKIDALRTRLVHDGYDVTDILPANRAPPGANVD